MKLHVQLNAPTGLIFKPRRRQWTDTLSGMGALRYERNHVHHHPYFPPANSYLNDEHVVTPA
eukprot:1574540-Lingulodinium_polyedra.AAC.1